MLQSVGLFKLRALARLIWVRIALISALAFVAAATAPLLSPLLPDEMRDRIDEVAVSDIISVLSGSMLAVATFSLSVMVSAHHYAASQVTPRAHRLLRNDARTQSVLATFIGAFVFSLVAVIIVNAGLFDGRDFAVLYGMTILVIGLVILALVRWVQQLSDLGSIEQTTDRVEETVIAAMRERMDLPWLGGRPALKVVPGDAIPIVAQRFGWVAHVDVERLSALAEEIGGTVHLYGVPGVMVTPGTALMDVDVARLSVEQQDALAAAVLVQDRRSFDQDPGFGIEVMAEIAQRALSPGLNDPRTAMDIVTRQVKILSLWQDGPPGAEPRFPRLYVPPLRAEVLLREALDPIARDGAHLVEVQIAVQDALAVLSRHGSEEVSRSAHRLSTRCLERSDAALTLAEDRRRVRAAAPGAREG
ncbi:DUF2254 domain-containing protein [Jannaschia formosa]|uniref:DUF2254 domain-containing protein n=1 Tax=Jannaschia formosa TaxID=2259592 RepID=UPI000E1C2054|nr:DUF2254 domain-containing protein [Jannaschia formosa]TFL19038.1 DUF2254 domain-containing protein [Jannaschia formosa]